jgi:hypothetical protein
MLRATAFALASSVLVLGCALPPTSAERLAQSAYDLNTAARFGRMDIALENVKEAAKEQFGKTHANWGKAIRIVDYEMGGCSIRKDGDADVVVGVIWQRYDETTMRNTEIAQRWASTRGNWALASEEERGGDPGLITELVSVKSDDAAPVMPARPRLQTRVIYEQ